MYPALAPPFPELMLVMLLLVEMRGFLLGPAKACWWCWCRSWTAEWRSLEMGREELLGETRWCMGMGGGWIVMVRCCKS